jgi:hypothetical protein
MKKARTLAVICACLCWTAGCAYFESVDSRPPQPNLYYGWYPSQVPLAYAQPTGYSGSGHVTVGGHAPANSPLPNPYYVPAPGYYPYAPAYPPRPYYPAQQCSVCGGAGARPYP